MLISRTELGHRHKRGFAWWRILAWLLLLLAAFGGVQYIHHAQQVWSVLQAQPPNDEQSIAALRYMLAWDIGYLIAAFIVLVVSAGCILSQAWARPALQVIAFLLCVWSAYRGVLMWQQWSSLLSSDASQAGLLVDLKRVLLLGVGLRFISILLLLWLIWQLGRPAVRLQFRIRRA